MDPLQQWWVHEVKVERHLGQGAEGDTWAPATTEKCMIDDRRRLVRSGTGEQVVSETTLFLPLDTADIPLESTVTLPAAYGNRTTTVLSVSRHDGGGLPTPDHVEVALA